MLEQIEKLFPGFLTRIRRFPATARVLFALMVVSGPAGLAWFYSRVSENAWLRRELRIPPNIVVIAAIVLTFICIALSWIRHETNARRKLEKFLADWLEFRDHFFLLCMRIDGYLIRDRKLSQPMEEELKELRELLPAITEYWSLRGRLREDVFSVGEDRLCVSRNARWEALKAKFPIVNDYATPFSFLLDRCQPIAEWNLRHDEIWDALHISDEFVEYLRFRHPVLKRIQPPRGLVKA
jgi:hypothetical protein